MMRPQADMPRRIFGHIALQEPKDRDPDMETVSRKLRGRYFNRRRTIRTPGAVDPFWAAAGRVTVLSRQYTYPLMLLWGDVHSGKPKTRPHIIVEQTMVTKFAPG